jgi:hypothetical protein
VWSDESVTQGLIGQFSASDGSNTVYTGSPDWQVCATGMDLDPFRDMEVQRTAARRLPDLPPDFLIFRLPIDSVIIFE